MYATQALNPTIFSESASGRFDDCSQEFDLHGTQTIESPNYKRGGYGKPLACKYKLYTGNANWVSTTLHSII